MLFKKNWRGRKWGGMVLLTSAGVWEMTKEEEGFVNTRYKGEKCELMPLKELRVELVQRKMMKAESRLGFESKTKRERKRCDESIDSSQSKLESKSFQLIKSLQPHKTIIQPIQSVPSILPNEPNLSIEHSQSNELPPPSKPSSLQSPFNSQIENQKTFEALLRQGLKAQKLHQSNSSSKKKKHKTQLTPAKKAERDSIIQMGQNYLEKASQNVFESGNLLRKSEMERLYKVFSILIDMKSDKRTRTDKRKKIGERREELFRRIKQLTLPQVREIAKILQPMNDQDRIYINVTLITKKNVTKIERTLKGFEEENKKSPNVVTFEQLEKQKEPMRYEPVDILNDSLSSSLSDDDSDSSSNSNCKSEKINELKEIMKGVPEQSK